MESVDTSGQPHNAEYLRDLAKSAINKGKEEFGCEVTSVVTDNASNVRKMRSLPAFPFLESAWIITCGHQPERRSTSPQEKGSHYKTTDHKVHRLTNWPRSAIVE